MPADTLEKLVSLARSGATVLFLRNLPSDVPGLADLEKRRAQFKSLIAQIALEPSADPLVKKAKIGDGAICVGSDVDALLRQSRARREPMVDAGLWFVRRAYGGGFQYFFVNHGDKKLDGWVALGASAKSAVLLDPLFADHAGAAALRQGTNGTQIYLQLLPGESRILRTFNAEEVRGSSWPNTASAGPAQNVAGTWEVKFVEGGPELPAAYATTTLASWTTRDDPEAKRFAGTAAYTITFDHPEGQADDWILDLGRVCETAAVTVNGHALGKLWSAPFHIAVGKYLKPGKNELRLELTNLGANRVRDLDIRKVKWKYFYDANVQSQVQRGGLDASAWPLRDSGLLGPVTLLPVKTITPPGA
jgi:hypothetical protein